MRQPITLDSGADEILARVHTVPDDEKPLTPERALWLSVIALCWSDAFGITSDFQIYNSDAMFRRDESTMKPNSDAITVEAYRGQCRRWLILDFGDFKYDRELCCSLAGIDPDLVRNAARRKLAQVKAGGKTTAKVIQLDRAFAALLDKEATMEPADLDAALEALAKLESAA